jgi:hypothetical protein
VEWFFRIGLVNSNREEWFFAISFIQDFPARRYPLELCFQPSKHTVLCQGPHLSLLIHRIANHNFLQIFDKLLLEDLIALANNNKPLGEKQTCPELLHLPLTASFAARS